MFKLISEVRPTLRPLTPPLPHTVPHTARSMCTPPQAYSVLSDREKRSMYDRYGRDGVAAHEQAESAGEAGGGGQGRMPRAPGRRPSRDRGFRTGAHFSFGEAQSLFEAVFGHDPFADFMSDPFGDSLLGGSRGFMRGPSFGSSFRGRDPFATMFGDEDLFGDTMDLGMGTGMGMRGSGSSFSSTTIHSSGFGTGRGAKSKSVSTVVTIGPDGKRRTRTETTTVHEDGSRETQVI
jgi:curved DNA-binding protein CbpA